MSKTKDLTVKEKIKKFFNIEWGFVDFFYAFCESRGIDDPQGTLTDEEYDKLDSECRSKITYEMLTNMRNEIIKDVKKRIYHAMAV